MNNKWKDKLDRLLKNNQVEHYNSQGNKQLSATQIPKSIFFIKFCPYCKTKLKRKRIPTECGWPHHDYERTAKYYNCPKCDFEFMRIIDYQILSMGY